MAHSAKINAQPTCVGALCPYPTTVGSVPRPLDHVPPTALANAGGGSTAYANAPPPLCTMGPHSDISRPPQSAGPVHCAPCAGSPGTFGDPHYHIRLTTLTPNAACAHEHSSHQASRAPVGRSSGPHATDSRPLPVKNLDTLSMPCMCHAPLSLATTSTFALGGVYPALAPHGSRVSAVRLSLTSPMRGTPWALFGSGRQAQSPKPRPPGGSEGRPGDVGPPQCTGPMPKHRSAKTLQCHPPPPPQLTTTVARGIQQGTAPELQQNMRRTATWHLGTGASWGRRWGPHGGPTSPPPAQCQAALAPPSAAETKSAGHTPRVPSGPPADGRWGGAKPSVRPPPPLQRLWAALQTQGERPSGGRRRIPWG